LGGWGGGGGGGGWVGGWGWGVGGGGGGGGVGRGGWGELKSKKRARITGRMRVVKKFSAGGKGLEETHKDGRRGNGAFLASDFWM